MKKKLFKFIGASLILTTIVLFSNPVNAQESETIKLDPSESMMDLLEDFNDPAVKELTNQEKKELDGILLEDVIQQAKDSENFSILKFSVDEDHLGLLSPEEDVVQQIENIENFSILKFAVDKEYFGAISPEKNIADSNYNTTATMGTYYNAYGVLGVSPIATRDSISYSTSLILPFKSSRVITTVFLYESSTSKFVGVRTSIDANTSVVVTHDKFTGLSPNTKYTIIGTASLVLPPGVTGDSSTQSSGFITTSK